MVTAPARLLRQLRGSLSGSRSAPLQLGLQELPVVGAGLPPVTPLLHRGGSLLQLPDSQPWLCHSPGFHLSQLPCQTRNFPTKRITITGCAACIMTTVRTVSKCLSLGYLICKVRLGTYNSWSCWDDLCNIHNTLSGTESVPPKR